MDALKAYGYDNFVADRLQGKFDLNPSFDRDGSYVGLWRYRLTVMRGKKYHRIVIENSLDADPQWGVPHRRSVHCFVDDEGNVYKPAGWTGPVKGQPRYNVSTAEGIAEFIDNADPYGGYLYLSHKKAAS